MEIVTSIKPFEISLLSVMVKNQKLDFCYCIDLTEQKLT